MSTHKWIDRICVLSVVISLLLTALVMNGEAMGLSKSSGSIGYEQRLFDNTRVHTIDIVMDDWDSFITTCENEEYAVCAVVIDGESYKNVGIRAKGNTSLSSVSQMGSERYSFKIEFDQYENGKSYHGLDKLSLNNLIQDNTMMKDYLAYTLMDEFGAVAPLCSYAYITVNGEDWGLYLAVEAVEDSFLQRNYGSNYGDLYKPDSLSFGGGRGNGRDFKMDDFDFSAFEGAAENPDGSGFSPEVFDPSAMMGGNMPEGFDPSMMMGGNIPEGFDPSAMMGGNMPDGFDPSTMMGGRGQGFDPSAMMGNVPKSSDTSTSEENVPSDRENGKERPSGQRGEEFSNFGGFGGFGMGSQDVKLQYVDDDPDSYPNIFGSAKTDVTAADQRRLIESLKVLSSGETPAEVVNVDAVIRYFVVHNFVCNGDSYTGSMIHNYYLYEEDGQLSMLPWDYNLAFGGFQSGNGSGVVNEEIDFGGITDRPMVSWIFASEEYTKLYQQYYQEFLDMILSDGALQAKIAETAALIRPYLEKDPSKFCTVEEFDLAVDTLKEFCALRGESVVNQLKGDTATVDASHLDLSTMGSMGMGGGRNNMGGPFGKRNDDESTDQTSGEGAEGTDWSGQIIPGNLPSEGTGDMDWSSQGFPESFPSGGFNPEEFSGQRFPEGFSGSPGNGGFSMEGFNRGEKPPMQ